MTHINTTHGIDLQLFADAGSLVNGTAGFVNASTGVTSAFDTTNTLAPELKSFYDTELLENARAEMVYAQLAKRQPLPANHHGAVEWRKWNSFDRASKLTEGVIPTGQKFGVTTVTGTANVMPPIVGVPCFFRCACGPSSRTCCPNLIFFRKGIRTGQATALMPKLISTAVITTFIMSMSFYSICCFSSCGIFRYGRIFPKISAITGAAMVPP